MYGSMKAQSPVAEALVAQNPVPNEIDAETFGPLDDVQVSAEQPTEQSPVTA
jgi:hypothetical protein